MSTSDTAVGAVAALARLRRAEAAMTVELEAIRDAIGEVEALLAAVPSPSASGLLTVVETARELRVSRTSLGTSASPGRQTKRRRSLEHGRGSLLIAVPVSVPGTAWHLRDRQHWSGSLRCIRDARNPCTAHCVGCRGFHHQQRTAGDAHCGLTLGELLRRWRSGVAGISGTELARRVGVSPQTVSGWEAGKRTFDPHQVDVVDRLALRSAGLFPTLARAVRNAAVLDAELDWWWQFPGARSPVWAWVLPPAGERTVSGLARWGPLEVAFKQPCGDEGLFLTLPLSAPDPPVHVALGSPAWVGFGRGRVPDALGVPAVPASSLGVRLHQPPDPALRVFGRGFQSLLDGTAWLGDLRQFLPTAPAAMEDALAHLPRAGEPVDLTAHPPSSRAPVVGHWPGERYRRARVAHGFTQREVADELRRIGGRALSDDQVANAEAGRQVRAEHIWARLDLLYGADGATFTVPVPVECVSSPREGVAAWRVRAPSWWRGPLWLQWTAPGVHGPQGGAPTARVELRRGPWRKVALVAAGAVISTHHVQDSSPDGLVAAGPADWQLVGGLGRHPDALPVDHDWEPVGASGMRQLWERHVETYLALWDRSLPELRDFVMALRERGRPGRGG